MTALWSQISSAFPHALNSNYDPYMSGVYIPATAHWLVWANGNDQGHVYRSVNGGVTFTDLGSVFPGQYGGGAYGVVMPNGDILSLGASTYSAYKTTGVSEGAAWSAVSTDTTLAGVAGVKAVLVGSRIYVVAGTSCYYSDNEGGSWTLVNASCYGGITRDYPGFVILPNGAFVVFGGIGGNGSALNDVWTSPNYGSTWTSLLASAPWSIRGYCGVVVTSKGGILMLGGASNSNFANINADGWISWDGGATWKNTWASGGTWGSRCNGLAFILPNDVVAIGTGYGRSGNATWYDMWQTTSSVALPGVRRVIDTRYGAALFHSAAGRRRLGIYPSGSL